MALVPIATTVFASDLVAMVDDLPGVAYYGGTSWNISVTQLSNEQQLLLIGNDVDQAVQAQFPLSAIATCGTPSVQARMALKMPGQASTENFEVKSYSLTQDGIGLIYILVNDARTP